VEAQGGAGIGTVDDGIDGVFAIPTDPLTTRVLHSPKKQPVGPDSAL
jgi:hypothetical protein